MDLDLLQGLQAGFFGHAHVHEHQIKGLLPAQRHRVFAVHGLPDRVAPFLKQGPQYFAVRGVVVGHQNRQRFFMPHLLPHSLGQQNGERRALPGWLNTLISPPCRSTICWVSTSPVRCRGLGREVRGEKLGHGLGRHAAARVGERELVAARAFTRLGSSLMRRLTVPPSGVNFTELPMMFTNTCCRRIGSPTTCSCWMSRSPPSGSASCR